MIAGMAPERHVLALAHIARSILLQRCKPTCCVLASLAGCDVLQQWGIKARPVYTRAAAMNASWYKGERIPGESFAVLCGPDPALPADSVVIDSRNDPDGGFNGHVIIAGKSGSTKFLLDLSAWSMHRPKRGVIIPYGICVQASRPFSGNWEISVPLPHGGVMAYGPHPNPDEWKASPNYTRTDEEHQELHSTMVHALRHGAEELLARTKGAFRSEPSVPDLG